MTTSFAKPLIAAGIMCCAGAAHAGVADWTQFNGVFAGDLVGGTDIEGSVIVGGNLSLNGGTVGTFLGDNTRLGIGVVGNLSGGGNMNGGRAEVGGSILNGLNPNSGGTVTQNSASIAGFFNDVWSSAMDASTAFSGLMTNSVTSVAPGNKLQFDARGQSDFAVFTIDASDFTAFQSFLLLSDTEATIVVNVMNANAGTISLAANMNENGLGMGGTSFQAERERVVWNFADATGTLNVNRQVEGSVLALGAGLNSAAVIEGNAVFASGQLNGQELHLPGFGGRIPQIPAPGSALLAGLGVFAVRRRR